jgi:Zn-dependent protease
MFLGPSWKIATVRGIPIRLHFTLVLVLPLLPWSLGWWLALAIGVSLFTSIVLHELGHSLVAIRYGCRVREILLLPIGGAARLESMPRQPGQEFRMALAGPAVSLALGVPLAAPVFLDYWGLLPWNTPARLLVYLPARTASSRLRGPPPAARAPRAAAPQALRTETPPPPDAPPAAPRRDRTRRACPRPAS